MTNLATTVQHIKSESPIDMSILRLKRYAREFFEIFICWHGQPPDKSEFLREAKRIRTAYHTLASTILFLNQTQPEQGLEDWLKTVPLSYKLKILQCFALLKESSDWAVSSLLISDPIGQSYIGHAIADDELLNKIRISCLIEHGQTIPFFEKNLVIQGNDGALYREFVKLCQMLHEKCKANNDQLFLALNRLIEAYKLADECNKINRDLNQCDHIEFLRRLTRP